MNTKTRRFHRQLIWLNVQLECFAQLWHRHRMLWRRGHAAPESKRRRKRGGDREEKAKRKWLWREWERERDEWVEGWVEERDGESREVEGKRIRSVGRWLVKFDSVSVCLAWRVSWYSCPVGLCLVDYSSKNKRVCFSNATESFIGSQTSCWRSFILPLVTENSVWEKPCWCGF